MAKRTLEGTLTASGVSTGAYALLSGVVGTMKNMAEHPFTYKMHPINELGYVFDFAWRHGEQALYVIGASAVAGLVYDMTKRSR